MKYRKFTLGYFYYNNRTGQYICEPTGIEYDSIAECVNFVKGQAYPKNDFSNYNISEFLLTREGDKERAEYIASCNLKTVVEDKADNLSSYKL